MLKLLTRLAGPMCTQMPRRDFLAVGSLGGLLLGDWLQAAAASPTQRSAVRGKRVVLLFLAGGPSQLETFDPKPEGPGTSTSLAGHIATRLPGVRFASYFPKLAQLADRLTVVRSFQTNHAEHNGAHKQILTGDLDLPDGKRIREPGLGAVYARLAGAVHPATGLPSHAVIPPTTRHLSNKAGFAGAYESVVEGTQPAWLGPGYAPFETKVPMAEGGPPPSGASSKWSESNPILDDMQRRVPDLVLDGRLELLSQLDRLDRRIDASGTMESLDQHTQRAVNLLRSGAMRKALDLTAEDPRTLAAYDTEAFRNYRCRNNSTFDRGGPSIGISLGRQLLLARRLCEAGCGFVTVIHANWDFHARKGIPNMPEGMSVLAPPLDHAVSAFLHDVEQRGLSDDILLVITGEFGRTPTLDENLGRHHWPSLCPLVLAGGGYDHGQVVGQSDRRGGEPAGEPHTIADFQATLMHALFDVGQLRLDPSISPQLLPRELGRPILG